MAHQASPALNEFWLGLILLGFVAFLVTLGGAIKNGFAADGARRPSLALWLAACLLCLGAWCFALSHFPAPLPTIETRERAALLSR